MSLAGKVAIITGGSRGIGEAIAEKLAAEGATIALVARGAHDLAQTAARIDEKATGRVVAFPCDLRRLENVQALIASVMAEFGQIDILVNNAGATKHGSLLDRADEDWLDAYDAKIHAFVRMCRECWPHLKASRGRVLNIGGVLANVPNPNALIGSTLAAAVVSLTKALAEYGRADGIIVNAINPGLIETGRFQQHLEELGKKQNISSDEERARMVERLAINRLGVPEDIAEVVAFLLSGRSAYIHGAIIDVDGGLTKGL
jgi:3-oxoacyl-[acyl-carrier protein] reductase